MSEPVLRPYSLRDLAACLAIFDGNAPRFFAPGERADFAGFLEALPHADQPYLVLERDGQVIGCGGLSIEPEKRQASLSWGMVARPHHGTGLGARLTAGRLALARATPGIDAVVIETSQHTQGFYARLGFAVRQVTPDGFGPGLDRWDMLLPLR
jgi:predicted GNAT family N-acyltransferase